MEKIWTHIPPVVRRLAAVALAMQVLLTIGYAMWIYDIPGGRKFNLDAENNMPTWWSCVILVVAGIATLLLSRINRPLGRPTVPWLIIGIAFFVLSAEEIASIHEDVGSAVGGGTDNVSVWPIVYAPVAIGFIWVLLRAVRDLPRPLAILGIAGMLCYVAVLGTEVLALYAESYFTIAFEENCEMLGTALMFTAVASELVTRASAVYMRRPVDALEPEMLAARTR
jgi:xanthosine utilization system XapX-like protein